MTYIARHWRGELPFALSFWVNLALLRGGIVYLEAFTHPPFLEFSIPVVILAISYFLIFDLIVLIWQIRGVIKAGDRYLSAYGSPIMATASHFGIAFCLLFTGFASHASYQSLFVEDKSASENQRSWRHSLLGNYTLTLGEDGDRIIVAGDMREGLTKELTGMLDQNRRVRTIVLASDGGRVSEGRGLAKLFQDRNLNTLVLADCKSACTTAFIGGQHRKLGPEGRLGFHQFSLDAMYYNPYVDPQSEQKIDLEFYARQGVGKAFLDIVFQATHQSMWFPTTAELLESGVVHNVGKPGPED
jgi:hypothetical protein